jgi:hypothetical protein
MTMADRLVALVALALLASACAPSPAEVRIHVDNETDVPIGVYVDGEWRGTDEPESTIVVPLGNGTPPLTIEARSPSGATLATLVANAAQVEALRRGDDEDVIASEVAVPCGIIRIVVGEMPPGSAPAPAEAVPTGPCP